MTVLSKLRVIVESWSVKEDVEDPKPHRAFRSCCQKHVMRSLPFEDGFLLSVGDVGVDWMYWMHHAKTKIKIRQKHFDMKHCDVR
jgi:hypothetical protein